MAAATVASRPPVMSAMESVPRAPKRKRADGVAAKPAKRRTSSIARPEFKAGDALRVVNSPGAALLAQQQAEREAALNLVTPPTTARPSQASLLDQENLGVIDLFMPPIAPPAPPVTRDRLQETIATEFGLEILLKHKELRLIDQELAKCQVALEQLRRCQVIPFPSQSADSTARLNASGGIGRPVRSHHARQASHPPPWGVVEGPYSRHYAQWLLPDSTFDGGVPEEYFTTVRPSKMLPDRHTRGSKGEQFLLTKRMRAGGLPTARLQSIPAGYAEPKETKGPMILKRAADDKLVKLVCLDCKREDFNSAQGFINHCRIAHARGFASHEAAAQACGQEIETNEVASVPTKAPAEPSAGIMTPSGVLVHPLVKSNPTVPMLSIPVPRSQRAVVPPKNPKKLVVDTAPPGFAPAASAPHLSKLFASAGLATNLGEMVTEATTHMELDESDDESSADAGSDFDAGEASDASTAVPMARMPSRGGLRAGPVKSTAPQESQKGVSRPNRRAAALQADASNAAVSSELEDLPHASSELSPHTMEANNAPSLVSDDDDYAESQSSTSPSTHSSDAEDEEHVDVEVEEVHEVSRLRGAGHHPLDTPRVEVPPALPGKSEDPELRASGNAKVAARRAPRSNLPLAQPMETETTAPKKRGRPRKVQP